MLYSQSVRIMAACSLVLVACVSGRQVQDDAFFPAPRAEEATLVVRNDYFGEMDVFAVMGSTRTRIGTVGTGTTQQFRLSRTLMARPWIQFQLDPLGPVGPFTYQPISFTPGSRVELAVAPTLQMSSYAIAVDR
jgi:hypothetical protein